MLFIKSKHTLLFNGIRATTATSPLSQASCICSLRWVEKREGGRKRASGKMFSAVIFGKIAVLFMRKGWGTFTKYKLYSTTAFRVVGVYGSSGISFKVLEDNGKFSIALRQLASLLVSSFQHHRKNISFPFSSSFSHTHVSHPYLCSPQCIESNIRLQQAVFPRYLSLFFNPHLRKESERE